MSNKDADRIPEELDSVAGWLRAQRVDPDPLTLDRVKLRAISRVDHPTWRFGFVKSRLATMFTILGLAGGTGGALALANNGNGNGNGNGGAASGQYKPGWGCGDKNHTHTGPPGNPNATSPCK